eukprot:4474802-Prymnesium_polylepis.1
MARRKPKHLLTLRYSRYVYGPGSRATGRYTTFTFLLRSARRAPGRTLRVTSSRSFSRRTNTVQDPVVPAGDPQAGVTVGG